MQPKPAVTKELLQKALKETQKYGQAKCLTTNHKQAVRIYALDHNAEGDGVAGAVQSTNGYWHTMTFHPFEMMYDRKCYLIPVEEWKLTNEQLSNLYNLQNAVLEIRLLANSHPNDRRRSNYLSQARKYINELPLHMREILPKLPEE